MAAPSPTVRGTPAGRRLKRGFRTLVTFSLAPTIGLWEITVKPPGLDGGEPINTTTMHNVDWHTKAPRDLVDSTDGTMKCAFDPKVYDTILGILNREQTITYRFSDGSTYAIFGFLQKFEVDDESEAEMPTATVTIVHTNIDPTSDAEQAPVMTEVAGT